MATIKEAIQYSKVNPDSAFATELRRRIESGQMDSELQSEGLTQYMSKPPEQSFVSKVKETGSGLVSDVQDIAQRSMSGETSVPEAVLQTGGAVAKAGMGVVGNAITSTPIVKDVVKAVAEPIGVGIKATQDWLANNPQFQNAVSNETSNAIASYLESRPDLARDAKAVNDIANAILMVKGGVQTAGTAKNVAEAGVDLTKQGIAKTGRGITAVAESPVVSSATTLVKDLAQPLIKVPSRLKTNLAEKQIQQAEVQSLPTKQARNVVNEGVDIADTKDIINLTKESKTPELRKLFSTVEDFASGNKKVDPAEIVGTPIIKKLKESEKLKDVIGSQLTEVSKNLGIVEKPELVNAVLTRLKEVPGMENLSLKGDVLDFKGTTIASQLTKSQRNTIQQAFKQSIKWGDGEKAHKFRQELFEILGGKKKSLETMTATQEESLDAIRKGLADVLDSKNGQYKVLNETYAKLAQPVSEMRKLMKGLAPDDPEDILNMSAGLLARRITSAAPSNANVRMILKSLDDVVPSDTLGRVESLQDFYNILNKYYDIAPRTGFQNLTKEAIDSSMVSKVTGKVGEYVGKTDATRQKALKEFLESVLEN